ncbi:MAG TPA: sigma-70 family RNA polymerase sigma factor [Sedimentisphaerales bacterium]|nr:sigma-70 family RNA polymerase sigma factor [Sedimentisphaerales bacterium]
MQSDIGIQQNLERAAEMFDKYGNMIRAVICFHLNDTVDPDDIFQSLFLSLVYRPVPEDIQDIRSYLYKTIVNDILDAVRRAKGYHVQISRYAQCIKLDTILQESPEETAMRAEQRRRMFELIEKQLPRHEAEAIVRRYQYNQSIYEAADRMRIHVRTYSRYLCMGLKRIRRFLAEDNQYLEQIWTK